MAREAELQLEKMIEIVVRSIPKEEAQARLYRETAQQSKHEMSRMLFEKLASKGEENTLKLKATLDILRKELAKLRSGGALPEQDPASCMPSQEFNANIRQTLRIARDLRHLAEKGQKDANDPTCRQMYELMAQMSQQLKKLAEEEVEGHIIKEKWD